LTVQTSRHAAEAMQADKMLSFSAFDTHPSSYPREHQVTGKCSFRRRVPASPRRIETYFVAARNQLDARVGGGGFDVGSSRRVQHGQPN